MTDFTDPNMASDTADRGADAGLAVRPDVKEHFWGYELRTTELVIDLAVMLRAVCGILTVASIVAAFGVWLLPAMAFVGSAAAGKMTVSVVLVCIGILSGLIAARGSRVRVQVDTGAGELRQIIKGPFGGDIVLARYGFDAVDSVTVATSRANRSFGQIQVSIRGIGPIPVADGAIVLLRTLRKRLASDCGMDASRTTRASV